MSCPKCPTSRVVDPPNVVVNDVYHPQVVQVIHPIEIINRHHCVPVFEHLYTCVVRDEFCPPIVPPVQVAQTRSLKKRKG